MQKSVLNKALFLDRDGIINRDLGFVYEENNFFFIDGIFDLVKFANKMNFIVCVVTNQSGISRGFYTENDFQKISKYMMNKFNEKNANIDAIYFCPFIFQNNSRSIHYLRKPNPGMFFKAKDDLGISLEKSVMLGDKCTDIIAACEANVGRRFLFDNGDNKEELVKSITYLDKIKFDIVDDFKKIYHFLK